MFIFIGINKDRRKFYLKVLLLNEVREVLVLVFWFVSCVFLDNLLDYFGF